MASLDVVYFISRLANQARSIDRFIDYFGGDAKDLDLCRGQVGPSVARGRRIDPLVNSRSRPMGLTVDDRQRIGR